MKGLQKFNQPLELLGNLIEKKLSNHNSALHIDILHLSFETSVNKSELLIKKQKNTPKFQAPV